MTRLLIVTEGPFYRRGDAVFDRFCYDRQFYDDYAAVFDQVRVAARIDRTIAVDGMHRADGEGIAFVDLACVQAPRGSWHPGGAIAARLPMRWPGRTRCACDFPRSPAGTRRALLAARASR
jgi:hypothetical protein